MRLPEIVRFPDCQQRCFLLPVSPFQLLHHNHGKKNKKQPHSRMHLFVSVSFEREMFQNIHRLIDHPIPPYNKKSLRPVRTEGVKVRGTTSGSSVPHDTDLTVSNNTSRCLGRPRPPLLLLQKGHSGRYFSGFPRCLAPTGSSLAGNGSLT